MSVAPPPLAIGELARLSGLSTHALRYYEQAGVLKPIGRAANGHRRYRPDDVLWLAFVLRLKLTGMPLAQIKRYAALRARGDATLSARLALLVQHREQLAARLRALADSAAALDDKIRHYQGLLAPGGPEPAPTRAARRRRTP